MRGTVIRAAGIGVFTVHRTNGEIMVALYSGGQYWGFLLYIKNTFFLWLFTT